LKTEASLRFLYILIVDPSLTAKSPESCHARSEQFPTQELLYTPDVEITNSLSL